MVLVMTGREGWGKKKKEAVEGWEQEAGWEGGEAGRGGTHVQLCTRAYLCFAKYFLHSRKDWPPAGSLQWVTAMCEAHTHTTSTGIVAVALILRTVYWAYSSEKRVQLAEATVVFSASSACSIATSSAIDIVAAGGISPSSVPRARNLDRVRLARA
jgi:hypothetical protein